MMRRLVYERSRKTRVQRLGDGELIIKILVMLNTKYYVSSFLEK
jgi:hypothetical protein